MFKRVFLIVLDSVGVGEAYDAKDYGDEGSNTLKHTTDDREYNLNVLERFGLLNLIGKDVSKTRGYYTIMHPHNEGKDSLDGHYEMMGIYNRQPFGLFPDGFPLELISAIKEISGREVIGNIAASGTEIIKELGEMQAKTGALIVYTSADSVLQIAANEKIIPVEELYDICEKVRKYTNENGYKIGRIIARPFVEKNGEYTRTPKRHDYAINPPKNALTLLDKNGYDTLAIGKIKDLFNDRNISKSVKTTNNLDGLMKLIDFAKSDFTGLCFINLNDFDTLYGHRRDKNGYLKALEDLNYYLPIFLNQLKDDDLMIITADHGNDPTFKGTDHTRENVPLLVYSRRFEKTGWLNERDTYADIAATILDNFKIENTLDLGESFLNELK